MHQFCTHLLNRHTTFSGLVTDLSITSTVAAALSDCACACVCVSSLLFCVTTYLLTLAVWASKANGACIPTPTPFKTKNLSILLTSKLVHHVPFGICSTPVLHIKDSGHSAISAGGRLQLNTQVYTLRMWLCMKWHGAWLYGVHRKCQDDSSFMWHQPCQCC